MSVIPPKRRSEQGVTTLIVMAITLPILVLLFAAVVDFARIPIAQSRLNQALEGGALGVEYDLSAGGGTYNLDGYTPAGINLCSGAVSNSSRTCDPTMTSAGGREGFFTPLVALEYTRKACERAAAEFRKSAIGFFDSPLGGPTQPFAMQFALVRFPIDTGTNTLASGPAVIAVSPEGCSGVSFSTIAGTDNSAVAVATNLFNGFRAQGGTAGTWRIVGASSDQWLPSLWLVGVGYYDMKHLIGFSTDRSETMVEYTVRPIQTVAGIQSPDV